MLESMICIEVFETSLCVFLYSPTLELSSVPKKDGISSLFRFVKACRRIWAAHFRDFFLLVAPSSGGRGGRGVLLLLTSSLIVVIFNNRNVR